MTVPPRRRNGGKANRSRVIVGGRLYMNTQTNLPEGSLLLLRILLGEDGRVVVNGEVFYRNPGRGVGVAFVFMAFQRRPRYAGTRTQQGVNVLLPQPSTPMARASCWGSRRFGRQTRGALGVSER
ncbi:MAG: hypothetical protein LC776_19625 [Acidobacteria bacterium]|nr:hypothetical protein [Acidobacteriota bacterium]